MAATYKNIIYQQEGPVARVILNRPEFRNAINTETAAELREVFGKVRLDNSVKVVILTGSGIAFSAGRDLKEFSRYTATAVEDWELRESGRLGYSFLDDFEKPTIAAVNGYALAGGCELAAGCDIRIAAESARFGLPEINFGGFPGVGATYLLPRLIGKSQALELIFTGDMIDAREALRIGLVNRVVPDDKLEAAAGELANRIAGKSLPALKLAKEAVNQSDAKDVKSGMKITAALRALAETTQYRRKGLKAVVEKRVAEFDDR